MPIRSVLVVAKKTALERYGQERADPNLIRMMAEDHPFIERLRRSHEGTQQAIATVTESLRTRGLRHRVVYAATKRAAAPHDLVISVGGDGTLLDASHGVVDQPVLAVNSSPTSSVGYFCCATVDNLEERLDLILSEGVEPVRLNRIAVTIGDRRLPYAALNDILFAHVNPAATARYELLVDGDVEEHWSSGVWVSTAAGSTAAIRAAGGVRQPILSRDLQYLVRELYRPPGTALRHTGGIISDSIEFISKLYEGAVFLDGHRLRYRVGFGDRIAVQSHEHPLRLFLFGHRANGQGEGCGKRP